MQIKNKMSHCRVKGVRVECGVCVCVRVFVSMLRVHCWCKNALIVLLFSSVN